MNYNLIRNSKFVNKIKVFLIIYIIIINYLAFMPISNDIGTESDKVNHILAFIVFTFLISQSFKISNFKIIISGLIFGIYIELIQYFIPYRSSDIRDIMADILGVLLALILLNLIVNIRKYVSK
jgi:VanZ family protein